MTRAVTPHIGQSDHGCVVGDTGPREIVIVDSRLGHTMVQPVDNAPLTQVVTNVQGRSSCLR
ncbi:hypothetical protein BIFGAL_03606 [Bifidobacterium gallicum DSM 20093 = LMG 11596]|uniref:Uncharacterized protein n=1 Tax=Bifidobacterium gallicum DSM 20093 = LMG 11596 TaxID=561180 RepID=D1NUS9_9BIFI|nr:hypothetical protein BIFGAL_03606 [Bifidobacterium gallicum DSM 20093 = LMG 11596]